jgi:hydroxypyruvate isomerase
VPERRRDPPPNPARRALLRSALAAGALAAAGPLPARAAPARLRQSAARWCYRDIPLPDLCRAARAIGLQGIDLLTREEWPVAADHGLVCPIGYGDAGTIEDGLNDRRQHDAIVRALERSLPAAAAAGVPALIAFFGNRRGRSDAEGMDACVAGLLRIKPMAEQAGVTVCVELLNSKVDHPDYQGDRTAFGVKVIEAVGSPRIRLLYDIYHMQIMEGDVIRTIQQHHQLIAHYHTGGVPGRHELDDRQELNWRGVCGAIADTGFTGFLAHEFIPTRDPLTSLREAAETCAV